MDNLIKFAGAVFVNEAPRLFADFELFDPY